METLRAYIADLPDAARGRGSRQPTIPAAYLRWNAAHRCASSLRRDGHRRTLLGTTKCVDSSQPSCLLDHDPECSTLANNTIVTLADNKCLDEMHAPILQ